VFPPNLESIINAITGFASPIIKDKLERSEIVIQLLKQFNLAPEHPPADFSAIYAYALVEYGVGKPKPILELFRQEPIRQAFRKAFDHNNPSILLSEVDTFIEGYVLGDEIKALGINVRREIAAFYIVFSEVAKRSRTPAEVLTNQAISSLHKKLATITEQLDRLPTLEGVRTEMARLAAQSYPALSENSNQCRAMSNDKPLRVYALSQQMRGWFETLGYRFEKYEVWSENYFEWIINIPVRRNRYDRILIRGIEGEAGLGDVMALRSSSEKQRTDEGWLVTVRRISRAARDEVEKEENRHLACYTFDELIDQDADFSHYLNWLEAEIKRRQIDTKYVPLACTKEEFDPVTKNKIGVSCYDERDGWIDGYIDLWLDDPAKEHISVLGEFGTGKTWFALHYAWITLQRYLEAKRRGVERPRLPLVIPLGDYAKAVSVESLFSEFFFRKYEIPLQGYSVFEQLNRMGKLLLIFDGFDEMAARVDRQQMINNFWELAKVVLPGAKVILTCRTEHFPEAKEGRALLNAELLASTANLTGETPQFEVLELEKFNDDQIQQVLSFQAQPTTVGKLMSNPQLLDLARRPVMTELILEALPDIEIGKPVDMSRVYLYAVRRKMERDIKAERTFTSLADKLYFLCELSWQMLSTNQMSLNYRLFPEHIRRLFGSMVQEEKDLDHWHHDMMGQTMLIRNADGDYTPAHRSLLEFFVAYKFAAELGVLAKDCTELAQVQSHLKIGATPQNYTWSSYFKRQMNEEDGILPIPPLKEFVTESLVELRQCFGQAPLTKAVRDLLVPMLATSSPLFRILDTTRGKTEAEVGYVGGNAATLIVKVDSRALEGRDISDAVICKANFSNASLRYVNSIKANLTGCIFTEVISQIFSVAFHPNGQFLISGDANGEICLWQVTAKKLLWRRKEHKGVIRSLSFSPNGQIIASASNDSTIKIWDVNTGECVATLHGHNSAVRSITFSRDGQILASGSEDCTVKFWKISTRECFETLSNKTGYVRSVAFSFSGKTLAYTSQDYTLQLWDVETRQNLKTLRGHTNWVKAIAFCPDGETIASASQDYSIKIWNIYTGQCLKSLEAHNAQINSLGYSSNGSLLASSSSDHTIKIWDSKTGQCLKTLIGHNNWVQSVAFQPKSGILASGSQDHTVRLWDVKKEVCITLFQGYSDWLKSIIFSPDGQTLASAGQDGIVRIWDVQTGSCLKELYGHSSWIHSLAFNPGGNILASSGDDYQIIFWNPYSGVKTDTLLQGHSSWIRSISFSLDGKIFASGSDDTTISLWDVHKCSRIRHLKGHTKQVRFIVFSTDSQILISCCHNETIKLWNVKTGECLKTLQMDTHLARAVFAFNAERTVFASGSDDYQVRLWDLHTSQCLCNLKGHTGQVKTIAFSPDGKYLVSGSDDLTIRLWDLHNNKCLRILHGHSRTISSLSFSPSCHQLASCGEDGLIKLWNVLTGDCLKTMRNERPYEGMNIAGVTGLTEAEKASLKALGAVEGK
jgi:predicted NACHT family NTPase